MSTLLRTFSRTPALTAPNRYVLQCQRRTFGSTRRASPRSNVLKLGTGIGLGLAAVGLGNFVYDAVTAPDTETPIQHPLRTYIVYNLCRSSLLASLFASKLGEYALQIPGVGWIAKETMFDQFVGGETSEQAMQTVRQLREEGTGSLLAYSVEADDSANNQSGHTTEDMVNEMIHSIDVAGDYEDQLGTKSAGRRTWVAVKISALLPRATSLAALSVYILKLRSPDDHIAPSDAILPLLLDPKALVPSSLTRDDIQDLRTLHKNLIRICQKAQERDIRVIIDAEYSWMQPALDFFQLHLMQQFNKQDLALVYGTFQAYLRRTPAHLQQGIAYAERNQFVLGVKLVRGAYWEQESEADVPPVWMTKEETDTCYNTTATNLLVPALRSNRANILFGTHNPHSVQLILNSLAPEGQGLRSGEDIPTHIRERLCFGTLYGMSTQLTAKTGQATASTSSTMPMTLKYVPYGELMDVMPYLARRAVENRSVMMSPGADGERKAAARAVLRNRGLV